MSEFEKVFTAKAKEIHKLAKDKGWYDEPRSPLESIALIVTELAEAIEELRNGGRSIYREGKKYEGVAVEMADAVIRIMDFCQHEGYPLAQAIVLKHDYNKTRPYRHGGKKF